MPATAYKLPTDPDHPYYKERHPYWCTSTGPGCGDHLSTIEDVDEGGIGFYVAAWMSDTTREVRIMVTPNGDIPDHTLSIGAAYQFAHTLTHHAGNITIRDGNLTITLDTRITLNLGGHTMDITSSLACKLAAAVLNAIETAAVKGPDWSFRPPLTAPVPA